MTVTADEKKRVVIPDAHVGDCFDVKKAPDGRIVLTKLEKVVRQTAKLITLNGRKYLTSDHPVSYADTEAAMADFP